MKSPNTAEIDAEILKRVHSDPEVMCGKPVIRGTRLTVDHVLNQLAHGATAAELVEEYENLAEDDVRACLLFAARSLEQTDFMPLRPERETR